MKDWRNTLYYHLFIAIIVTINHINVKLLPLKPIALMYFAAKDLTMIHFYPWGRCHILERHKLGMPVLVLELWEMPEDKVSVKEQNSQLQIQ